MSSELPNNPNGSWSLWSDSNYLNQMLFKEKDYGYRGAPVSLLPINNLVSNTLIKGEPVHTYATAAHPKKVLNESSGQRLDGSAAGEAVKLTNEKSQIVVDKTLTKNQRPVLKPKQNPVTEVNKAKHSPTAFNPINPSPSPTHHQPLANSQKTSVVNSTNAKTEKIVNVAIPKAPPQPKIVEKKVPRQPGNASKVAAKPIDTKTANVVKKIALTNQPPVKSPSINAGIVNSSKKQSPPKPSQSEKSSEKKKHLSEIVLKDNTKEKVVGPGDSYEAALVISQQNTKKITLEDIDAELSSPIAAAEYFLNPTLEEELKKLCPKDLLSVYTKLLQRGALSFLAVKGKLSDEKRAQAQTILNKHLCFLKSGLIDKNDAMFFPLLYPLVEICVNSSHIESCCLGLRLMTDFFSQPHLPKAGREVQLIENFLLRRKKIVFNCDCKAHENREIVFEEKHKLLNEAIGDLLKVFVRAAPLMKCPEIALTLDAKADASIIIKYLLVWLEKIHSSSQPHMETLADKKHYAHLIQTLEYCEEDDFKEVFDFFQCLPIEKMNFKNSQCSIQKVLQGLFKRKFKVGTDIEPKVYVLSEYCTNIWRFSPETVNALKDDFETYLFSIQEYIKKTLNLFTYAQGLLISQAEFQNAIRAEVSEQPQKISSKRRNEAQGSKFDQINEKDDIAKNVHFKAASSVFGSIFDFEMKSLPENKAERKRILENLWDVCFKAHVNFNFDHSSLLLAYIDSCDLGKMDEQSEEMIMFMLKKMDWQDQLEKLATDRTTGTFIKKCFEKGVNEILSLDALERITLYKNMIVLMKVLMGCDVESKIKIDAFTIWLPILLRTNNRHELIAPVYTIFDSHHKEIYKNNKRIYWEHYYIFGNIKNKSKIEQSDSTAEELDLRRQAIKTVIRQLSVIKGSPLIIQMLDILKDKEAVEFRGYFNEIRDCYHLVLDRLSKQENRHLSLKIINTWFAEQIEAIDNPCCVFLKTPPFENTQKYSLQIEQQAHRELMMEIFTTYKKICEESIELDKSIQKNCCETFAYNLSYMLTMKAFEIFDEKDLTDFKTFLDMFCVFMEKYRTKDHTPYVIKTLYQKVLELFSRATLKTKSVDLLKKKFQEKWTTLFPPKKTSRVL